jgi:hypothetical protein
MAKYYTLAEKDDGENGRWCILFGDYDKAAVIEERDIVQYADGTPRSRLKILETSDVQADINAALAELNRGE